MSGGFGWSQPPLFPILAAKMPFLNFFGFSSHTGRRTATYYVQVGSHPVTSINEPTKHNDPAVLQWSFEGHHDIVGTIIVKCSNDQHNPFRGIFQVMVIFGDGLRNIKYPM